MKNYRFRINGNDYAVVIGSIEDGVAEVSVNDVPYSVEIEGAAPAKPKPATAATAPTAVPATDAHPAVARTTAPAAAASAGDVKSPLPGVILKLSVNVGDKVGVGERLLVLEAMKMENNIDSDRAGVVKSVAVRQGDSVLEGDVLLTIV